MICTGHKNSTAASKAATTTPDAAATPMARLMLRMSCLPQYWLTRMPRPLCTPNTMEMSRKTGTLAAVTAAISVLPSWLTMKVSMSPREKVMRFCSTMGMLRYMSRL